MQPAYIPAPDADFQAWFLNFSTLLTTAPATYGLVSGDATAVAAKYTAWSTAYVLATNPSTRTSVTIATKDAARSSAEPLLRIYAVQISRNPAVTNGNKTAIGVNLPNASRTPVPPPTTQPALSLVTAIHNLQVLAYRDTSTPTVKAKPFGAIGLDLRQTIATAPGTDPNIANPLGVMTKSPLTVGTVTGDVGKLATYWGRWTTRSGPGGAAQFGPWGAPLTVAIV